MPDNKQNSADEEGSVTRVIRRMKTGDESGALFLWKRFYDRLTNLVRNRLRNQMKTMADEEDVALESLADLFRGLMNGDYEDLDDRESLWRLLVTVASRNVIDEVNRESRQKRGGGRVMNESAFDNDDSTQHLFDNVASSVMAPDVDVMVMERCTLMLESLDNEELQAVVIMKTARYENKEISEALGLSLRTVERRLEQIRGIWSEEELTHT